jgi:tyrosyl-tRNA synthetase
MTPSLSPEQQLALMKERTDTFHGQADILERLKAGKPLRVKLGVDPTRPDLTFGHMVCLNKLRQFQDLGHQAVLIIGDYTTRIGDPSGRSDTRPVLTGEEIAQNASTYLDQAFRILDKDKTEVRPNGEWFAKMSFLDCLQLARHMTVAQLLDRDDFSKRYAAGTPISLVEFMYPLLQGYDSVMIDADLEIGGSDQLFNNLVGRRLQTDAGKAPQAVITMPLLVGLDGVKKMSKSLGNYIAFNDSPKDMFGKIMSIPDEAMWTYYRFLCEMPEEEITAHKRDLHPMEAKKRLATALTGRMHSLEAARHEREQFEAVFSKKQVRDDIAEYSWDKLLPEAAEAKLVDLLGATGLFESKKELRRLFEQGAVKVNEETVTDTALLLRRPLGPTVVQAGKRTFVKLVD